MLNVSIIAVRPSATLMTEQGKELIYGSALMEQQHRDKATKLGISNNYSAVLSL